MLPYTEAPPLSHRLQLDRGMIYLWLVDITGPSDTQLAALQQWLTPQEMERNRRYAQAISQRRDVICRASLRQLLCRYLGLANAELNLGRTENGKPLLIEDQSHLQFNYSHSGDYAAFAFVRGPQVGVDIEHSLRSNDLLRISKRFFSAPEVAELAALPEDQHRDQFFAYWTLKEAYIKARGEGIFIGLQNFSFHLPDREEKPISVSFGPADFDNPAGWQFFRLHDKPQYPVAVALKDQQENYQLKLENPLRLHL